MNDIYSDNNGHGDIPASSNISEKQQKALNFGRKQDVKSILAGMGVIVPGFVYFAHLRSEARETLEGMEEMHYATLSKELAILFGTAFILYKIAIFAGEMVRSKNPYTA